MSETLMAESIISATSEHILRRLRAGEITEKAALESLASAIGARASEFAGPKSNLFKDNLKRLTLDDLNTKPPDREFLLTCATGFEDVGFYPAGKVGMLVGAGAVGKSTATTQLAVSIASRMPWFNKYKVPKAGRVLLAFGEETYEDSIRRFWLCVDAMSGGNSAVLNRMKDEIVAGVDFIPLSGKPSAFIKSDRSNVFTTENLTDFQEVVSEGKYSLVVIDPQSRFSGSANENDNGVATVFVQAIETLTQLESKPSVIVVHHTSKSGRDGAASSVSARGAGAYTDGMRWCMQLSSIKHKTASGLSIVLSDIVKTNYTEQFETQALVRRKGGLLTIPSDKELPEVKLAMDNPNIKQPSAAVAGKPLPEPPDFSDDPWSGLGR